MTIAFRPLAEVKMMLEEVGTDVSYAYDDLIFTDHSAFILQFDDDRPGNLKLYFNKEINKDDLNSIKNDLYMVAKKRKLKLIDSGHYSIKQKESAEEIELKFFQKK